MTKGTAQYGNFVRIPYAWFNLRGKYEVPEEKRKTNDDMVNITDGEVCLLARIAGWNDSGKECMETNGDLAEYLNVSVSTVKRYLHNLRMIGFIKTYEEKDDPVHTSNRVIYVQYDLVDKKLGRKRSYLLGTELVQPLTSEEEVAQPLTSGCSPISTYNTYNTNITDNTIYACKEENLPFGGFDGYDDVVDVNSLDFDAYRFENKNIKKFMKWHYESLRDHDEKDIRNSLIDEFAGKNSSYKCGNLAAVETYADYLINSDLYCTK